MLTSLTRIIKFALQNFWRNIWLSVITVSMLVLTLLTVNILVVLQVLGQAAVRSVEERIDITVSLRPGISESVVGELRTYLSSLTQVAKIETITGAEALAAFRARHEQNPQILRSLEEVGENPFGPTLVVRARSSQDYPFIFEALENPLYREHIEDKHFTDHQLLIERITRITNRLRNFGIMLASIFAAIAVLIIFNTIRVAIYTYREEIGIMKLVGASNWFVRAPFLLESIFYSVIAVLVTAAIVFPIVAVTEPYLEQFFDGARVGLLAFFKSEWGPVFGAELAILIVLNMISSSVAIGRYLKT